MTEIFETAYIYLSAYNIPHALPVEAQIDIAVLIKATLRLVSIVLLDCKPFCDSDFSVFNMLIAPDILHLSLAIC